MSSKMNPPDEIPQSSVNGQTRTIEQCSARPNKPKPRKGNVLFTYSMGKIDLREI